MITKMKKVNLLVFHQEYEDFLSQLQNLGVVHIQELESGTTSEEFEQAKAKYEHYAQVLASLNKVTAPAECTCKSLNLSSAEQVVEFTEEQLSTKIEVARQAENTQKELAIAAPFGEFDTAKVEALAQAGYQMNLYACPAVKFSQEWVDAFYATPVSQTDSTLYFVTFSPEKPAIDAESIELPALTITELQAKAQELAAQAAGVEQNLQAVKTQYTTTLEAAQAANKNAIQLSQVHLNSQDVAGDKLKLLEGWIPEEKEADVKAMLDASGAYYEIREAQKGDNVPIKLRNNWFARQFEVLTGMYGMPNYDEWDPTPVLAPFYSLFFAICMGDCGYGLLLILFGAGVKAGKIKGGLLDMFNGLGNIIMILGAATLVVGFFLGTCMGVNMYEYAGTPEALRSLMAPFQGTVAGYSTQMVMALVIGIFHICLAMTFKAIIFTKKNGFAATISTWSWLLLIVGAIVVAILFGSQVLDEEAMKWALIGIGGVSALGIYLLNDIHRNPLVNVGAGLYDTYNMASGLMGDVLSYIRLYALGLSGGMLGDTFNDLGFQLIEGDKPVWMLCLCGIGTVLILFFGHILNIAMAALGAFVHPLRLTFVEYFKNVGYEGKGTTYVPFDKNGSN